MTKLLPCNRVLVYFLLHTLRTVSGGRSVPPGILSLESLVDTRFSVETTETPNLITSSTSDNLLALCNDI